MDNENLNKEHGATLNGNAQETPVATDLPEDGDVFADPMEHPTVENFTPAVPETPENVIAGLVGSFLFSLIGAVIYFVIYQMNVIAGIVGLVTFVLANFGYGLFAGKKNTMTGVIASCVFTVVSLVLAEYACVAYIFYDVYKDYGVSFFDVFSSTLNMILDPEMELIGPVLEDLGFSLLFGALAAFGSVRNAVAASKKK